MGTQVTATCRKTQDSLLDEPMTLYRTEKIGGYGRAPFIRVFDTVVSGLLSSRGCLPADDSDHKFKDQQSISCPLH